MSSVDKRLALFHQGAKAASKYRSGDETYYFCPICKIGFTKEAAIKGELSLEHIPPEKVGGKGLLLTCRNCNSSSGYKIDAAVANREELREFSDIVSGNYKDVLTSGVLKMCGQHFKTSMKNVNGTTEIRIIPKANNPKEIEKFRHQMKTISEEGNTDGMEFNLSKQVILDLRLAKIGDLKSSFLLLFALLGYRYAFDNKLDIVRNQLIEPNKDILGTKFWVELDESDAIKNTICMVSNPLPFYFVIFDRFGVILPRLNNTMDLYEELVTYWQRGERISLNAEKVIEWPDRLLMHFDFD